MRLFTAMTVAGFILLIATVNGLPTLLLRGRDRWGVEPFFVFVGAIQLLQVFSAGCLIPLSPKLEIALGSALLYPWTLAGVVLSHKLAGPSHARALVYGLFFANVFVSTILTVSAMLTDLGGLHLLPDVHGGYFRRDAGVLFWGTLLLFLESLLVPILFELYRTVTRHLPTQVFSTLASCLLLDSFLFPAVAFAGAPLFSPIFFGTLLGKLVQAAVIASLSPLVAVSKTPQASSPLRLGPVLRFLLFDMDLQQLLTTSYQDPLTNLWNRRYFESALTYEWSRALRSRSPLALLTVDLDHLKQLNDTFGHAAGDWALQAVAEALRATARRESDCAARLGGDEFALLLPNTPEEDAAARAQRLVELVGAAAPPKGFTPLPRLSVSVGVATIVPSPTMTPQELVRRSDEALYRAKQGGRGRWVSTTHQER